MKYETRFVRISGRKIGTIMKTSTFTCKIGLMLLLAAVRTDITAAPLGTAFTYHGRLTDGPNLVNGTVPMVFTLWDDPALGSTVGSPSSVPANVSVASGLFTIDLDFGPAAFSGDARWLEITVNGT